MEQQTMKHAVVVVDERIPLPFSTSFPIVTTRRRTDVWCWTYHLVVDLVEVNLADFIHHVLALERHEGETWKK